MECIFWVPKQFKWICFGVIDEETQLLITSQVTSLNFSLFYWPSLWTFAELYGHNTVLCPLTPCCYFSWAATVLPERSMSSESSVSPGTSPWWPSSMGIFPVWIHLHPSRGPYKEWRPVTHVLLRSPNTAENRPLPVSSSHFQGWMTHSSILAGLPGSMQSAINQAASAAGSWPYHQPVMQ